MRSMTCRRAYPGFASANPLLGVKIIRPSNLTCVTVHGYHSDLKGSKAMADFLDEKLKEIDARLKELRPLVEEFNRLESARSALSGVTSETAGGGTSSTGRRRGPGRPRGSGRGRRGRPRGGEAQAKEGLALGRARPGITIRELAEAMSIQPNYLYRILPQLEQEGQVKREDKGWSAAGGADGVGGADG